MSARMNSIGIMQGRLGPSEDGRLQGFPAHTWQAEFEVAKRVGLEFIEWIYEKPNCDSNPIVSQSGQSEVKELVFESGVKIKTICADYFMDEMLISEDGQSVGKQWNHLEELIRSTLGMGIEAIVLPFVDQSSLRNGAMIRGLV